MRLDFKVSEDAAGQRLDKFLRRRMEDMPLSHLYKLVRTKKVRVNGARAEIAQLLKQGDEITVHVLQAVAPPPQGRVVDACAGAGGKTLALAALMAGKGRLLALDPNGKKLEELRRRARRADLSNVTARPITAPQLPDEARPASWDRVLVDAPCSRLGTLRRNPEARWRLSPAEVRAFPSRQVTLLVTSKLCISNCRDVPV